MGGTSRTTRASISCLRYGFLAWVGLEKHTVRAVHIAVVGEEQDMRALLQPVLLQRLDDAAAVPVEVLDHDIVSGQIAADLTLKAPDVRHIDEAFGSHVRIVRRLIPISRTAPTRATGS
ncbi:hypothetical protein SBA3_250015 [Candidatus Sulfopaludibacter sp. SbA3]|nr:hypothetical protein SBA3_250015 [Candidatus Sulfopaludibacter sp. SbA3]